MSFIGINGFDKIGKNCLLQLIDDKEVQITCINSIHLPIDEIEHYLKYDTIYNRNFDFEIISKNQFKINHHLITLVSDRNPKNIPWCELGCNIVIESSETFLTSEPSSYHNIDNVIIASETKDNTSTYIYGVNHEKYKGEKFVSASSCTSNCLAPMLHFLSQNYGIKNAVFKTIQAKTYSQTNLDSQNALSDILPELDGKVFNTNARIPFVNVELNVELESKPFLQEIYDLIKNNPYYGILYDIIDINDKKLLTTDFTIPCIIDSNSTMDMGNGKFKFMIWYDNEISYSRQIIRLVKEVTKINNIKRSTFLNNTDIKLEHFIENIDLCEKRIVCRFDYDVPIIDNKIVDDSRIYSTIETIQYILQKTPKYVVLVSHLGSQKESKSLNIIIPTLEKYLEQKIIFLDKGLSFETMKTLSMKHHTNIFLLENIQFHKEETEYEKMTENEIKTNTVIDQYKKLGDVFICDAFGCMNRKHMSIHAISKCNGLNYGFGYLVKKEMEIISNIFNANKKKLVIIGGNKSKEKIPFIDLMKTIPNTTLFVGGKIASEYVCNPEEKNIHMMKDGYGNVHLNFYYRYIDDIKNTNLNVYDIGDSSLKELFQLVEENEIIFWNGSLGVIENNYYIQGTSTLIKYLKKQTNKTIIIGGGVMSTLIDKNGYIHLSTSGGILLEILENVSRNNGYLVGIDIFR